MMITLFTVISFLFWGVIAFLALGNTLVGAWLKSRLDDQSKIIAGQTMMIENLENRLQYLERGFENVTGEVINVEERKMN